MLGKGRLFPYIKDDTLKCFITFYITDDIDRYAKAYPWEVLEDDCFGHTCYISQMLTDKKPDNPKLSFDAWSRFKIYIKVSFPTVQSICWKRWDKKSKVLKYYKKEI